MTSQHSDDAPELLVHISAPTSAAHDKLYREQASQVLNFVPVKRINIGTVTWPPPQTKRIYHNDLEEGSAKKRVRLGKEVTSDESQNPESSKLSFIPRYIYRPSLSPPPGSQRAVISSTQTQQPLETPINPSSSASQHNKEPATPLNYLNNSFTTPQDKEELNYLSQAFDSWCSDPSIPGSQPSQITGSRFSPPQWNGHSQSQSFLQQPSFSQLPDGDWSVAIPAATARTSQLGNILEADETLLSTKDAESQKTFSTPDSAQRPATQIVFPSQRALRSQTSQRSRRTRPTSQPSQQLAVNHKLSFEEDSVILRKSQRLKSQSQEIPSLQPLAPPDQSIQVPSSQLRSSSQESFKSTRSHRYTKQSTHISSSPLGPASQVPVTPQPHQPPASTTPQPRQSSTNITPQPRQQSNNITPQPHQPSTPFTPIPVTPGFSRLTTGPLLRYSIPAPPRSSVHLPPCVSPTPSSPDSAPLSPPSLPAFDFLCPLPLLIDPPFALYSPVPETCSNPPQVPTALAVLVADKLAGKFQQKLKEQKRELREWERGYWLIDMARWRDPMRKIRFWGMLKDAVEAGRLGGVMVVLESEDGQGAGERWRGGYLNADNGYSREQGEKGNRIRVYCWGGAVEAVWSVLYVLAYKGMEGVGWWDASGERVVRMV
ncbi:Similar to hypothetical protein [Tuber melanosporum Mel28]; acc. no. XP_002835772 [Pyronema omphalodes CBS 100304]|uniref:Uncharacterized protein n=1 Tax=Pyronema omphalodes (strain CBS 100304) TaxID=1076935 RepID=U4LCQ1_PYROM|nr:Similar to hypothetical protein [Tuber melanosporum Mel28]; acc. no. XP_002835772 [Pyronema omphalodes CBS 100304]